MALKAVLDSLEGVAEDLHQHYEQDGDVYRIRVDGYDDTGLKAKASGDWDKLKGDMEARHAKELEAADSNNALLASQLEQIIKKDAATAALADAGARVTAMLPHVLERVSIVSEEGSRRAVARGLDGESTDIAGLVSQMREAGEEWDWSVGRGFRWTRWRGARWSDPH
jgi:hypothetical protein